MKNYRDRKISLGMSLVTLILFLVTRQEALFKHMWISFVVSGVCIFRLVQSEDQFWYREILLSLHFNLSYMFWISICIYMVCSAHGTALTTI